MRYYVTEYRQHISISNLYFNVFTVRNARILSIYAHPNVLKEYGKAAACSLK